MASDGGNNTGGSGGSGDKSAESEDLIRYDILAQEALRGVVKRVLHEVARVGSLPGDHHFYITFATQAAGVKLSPRMKAKYPDEMTIVIQHQFWDLKTTDSGFSIGLSFNDIPETLVVPFAAIRGFFDPSVQFGLQFETEDADQKAIEGGVTPLPAIEHAASGDNDEAEAVEENESDAAPNPDGADVVSLDAFRKK